MESKSYQLVRQSESNTFDSERDERTDRVDPLEMESDFDQATVLPRDETVDVVSLLHRASAHTTLWLVTPSLAALTFMVFHLTGRVWTCAFFSLHATLSLVKACGHHKHENDSSSSSPLCSEHAFAGDKRGSDDVRANADARTHGGKRATEFCATSVLSVVDLVTFGGLYQLLISFLRVFSVDEDGTLVIEWIYYHRAFTMVSVLGYIIFVIRILVGGRLLMANVGCSSKYLTNTFLTCQSIGVLGNFLERFDRHTWLKINKFCFNTPPGRRQCFRKALYATTICSGIFLLWPLYSLMVHFGPFEPEQPNEDIDFCDPLDTTECCLPFPSMHFLKIDPSTETGYRVDLRPDTLPKLKGRIPMSTDFLNKMDGFSTMGPLLFYLEGMRESHESYARSSKNASLRTVEAGATRLRGNEELHLSTTPWSTTLLLDVSRRELVPHSAEIDHLDPDRPLVLVFPARPLQHNTHYALAVVNATDAWGRRVPPAPGLVRLLDETTTTTTTGSGDDDQRRRRDRFLDAVLPALEEATRNAHARNETHDWGGELGALVRDQDPAALQLLFDFRTTSKTSQLRPVRAVRDAVLRRIHERSTPWEENVSVRAIRQVDHDCHDPSYPLARTVHGELDVPWFLTNFGPGYRDAILSHAAVESGVPTSVGKAKFVVYVPCALKNAAMNESNATAQPLRAVVEFGHGLFGSRSEASEGYLIKMANDNGYIIVAMDWRGMSQYDYPTVVRTMLADPTLFESVRDNLIQGYANKFALQHFIRHGMLDLPWFEFSYKHKANDENAFFVIPRSPETEAEDGLVPSIFYGISQGGILGAGYVGLSGVTRLISRVALGVPGTPFSFILSRSLEFAGYDVALLMNFYNNRHVRIFLSLAQMCWDSVEASGVFGRPLDEEWFPPIILQSGLGDTIVPSLAAERLARALNAVVLPGNPRRPIFGVHEAKVDVPHNAVLTEMLYEEDYESLPKSNELTMRRTGVHFCLRRDLVLRHQLNVFFRSGRVIDPCADSENACVRKRATC